MKKEDLIHEQELRNKIYNDYMDSIEDSLTHECEPYMKYDEMTGSNYYPNNKIVCKHCQCELVEQTKWVTK